MTFEQGALVGVAAFVAAAINSAAGGGSFISFPTILGIGLPPISANATNNTAMWVGSFSSAGALRSEIDIGRRALFKMLAISAAGSALGALLLLRTTNAQFTQLIPWLLLAATTLFVGGPSLTRRLRGRRETVHLETPAGYLAQFAISVYGGFFGAAIGILMLALFGLLGLNDLRKANAFKVLLSTVINGVAVVPFVFARVIAWEVALVASLCALAGGYLGADAVKRLPSIVVRRFVVTVACSMTLYFFWKTYLAAGAGGAHA